MGKICFAIPVHEKREVIENQLENIRYFCPNSSIVYFINGDPHLCDGLGYPVCPYTEKITWETLVRYHLKVMEWLEEINYDYDYLIALDSDILFAKKGFEEFVSTEMKDIDYMAVRIGMPEPDWPGYVWMKSVWKEWQPIFNTSLIFACNNPGQVFSRIFVRKLLNFNKYPVIKKKVKEEDVFLFEEILFPTIVYTLGLNFKAYPESAIKWLRWRPYFNKEEVQRCVLTDEDCYFFHPISRDTNDQARIFIRSLIKEK